MCVGGDAAHATRRPQMLLVYGEPAWTVLRVTVLTVTVLRVTVLTVTVLRVTVLRVTVLSATADSWRTGNGCRLPPEASHDREGYAMAEVADRTSAIPYVPSQTEPPMRASDAERLATVLLLQDAVGRGLLAPDEGSERMAAAFAAVHVRDLGPLTADLPPSPPTGSGPPGRRGLATMAVEQLRFSLGRTATGRLHPVRVAIALLIAVLLAVAIGIMAAELFDGGPRPGLGGFGRR